MNKIFFYFTTVTFILCTKNINAQNKTERIPFTLTAHNNIAIPVLINGQDSVYLMFHLASNSIELTKDVTPNIKSVVFNEKIDGIKSWGSSENSSRISTTNQLQIGTLNWSNKEIGETQNSGPGTDGKFGTNLFENKVIQIDFEKHELIIHENVPKDLIGFEKLAISHKQGTMYIDATAVINEIHYPSNYMIHSGYGGGLLFNDEFTKENKLDEQLTITGEKILKDSFGNEIITKKAVLAKLTIGKNILNNVAVSFFSGAIGRQKINVIGGDLLKRFHLIIDAKREYIYLKENSLSSVPYTIL